MRNRSRDSGFGGLIPATTTHPSLVVTYRMKSRLFLVFLLGVLIGFALANGFMTNRPSPPSPPVVSITGQEKLDTATHEDPHLNNAIFIRNQGVPHGRVYLRFNDDQVMNEVIGKNVTVMGHLTSARCDNGDSITELLVESVSQIE